MTADEKDLLLELESEHGTWALTCRAPDKATMRRVLRGALNLLETVQPGDAGWARVLPEEDA